MSVRFCTACDADVEVAEGYCLLGHLVRRSPSTSPLDELRSEIDKTYEEAAFRVASVIVEEGETPRGAVTTRNEGSAPPPPPPPPPRPHRPSYEEMWAAYGDDSEVGNDPIAAFAPPPRMDWGPKRNLSFRRGAHAGSNA